MTILKAELNLINQNENLKSKGPKQNENKVKCVI